MTSAKYLDFLLLSLSVFYLGLFPLGYSLSISWADIIYGCPLSGVADRQHVVVVVSSEVRCVPSFAFLECLIPRARLSRPSPPSSSRLNLLHVCGGKTNSKSSQCGFLSPTLIPFIHQEINKLCSKVQHFEQILGIILSCPPMLSI